VTNVISLQQHQASLTERADEIVGDAILLKSKLKNACNVPLPDEACDNLIRALAVFVAEARSYER